MSYIFSFIIIAAAAAYLWAPYYKTHKQKALLFAVLIIAASMALYTHLGQPKLIKKIEEEQQQQALLKEKIGATQDFLQNNPKNPEAWNALAELFMVTSQYEAAAGAAKKAVTLSNAYPPYILLYAKAQTFANDGAVTAEAKEGFKIARMLMPDAIEPRFFLAVELLQSGNKKGALIEFEALLKSLPPEDPLYTIIEKRLENIR